MLFDLSSPKRKNVVRVVYGFLAVIFAGGFVFFGIGSESGGGGLFDGIFGDSANSSVADQYEQQIEDLEEDLEGDPENTRALVEMVQYRTLSGQAQLETDETGQAIGLTDEARSEFEEAIATWERYLETDPKKPDATAVSGVLTAYQYLGDFGGAADAQELAAEAEPDAIGYATLAQLRYQDIDLKRGDAARDEALELAKNKAQEKQISTQLEDLRKQVVDYKKQLEKQPDTGAEGGELENPFGGLGPDPGFTAP